MFKYGLLTFFFCLLGKVIAQSDTLMEMILEEKIIIPKGYKKEDLQTSRSFHVNKLSDLLKNESTLFIKQYGASSLATSSVRGMSSSHTQVLWNGLPISSPSLGQTDLSQINSSGFDKISLVYGGGEYGSYPGAIGATLFLDKNVFFRKQNNFAMSREFASYKRNAGYSSLTMSDSLYFFDISVQTLKSENNFEFYNTRTKSYESRRNAQSKSLDFQSNLGYKLRHNQVLNLGIWLNESDHQIPRNLQMDFEDLAIQKQSDESKRLFLSWEVKDQVQRLILKTAFLHTTNVFEDQSTPLAPSSTLNYSYIQQARYLRKLSDKVKMHIGMDIENHQAETSTYTTDKKKEFGLFSIGFDYDMNANSGLYLSYKSIYEAFSDFNSIYSIGAKYRYGDIDFYGHFDRSYRSPSLNDMYWSPGGNADLKPERGWNGELSISKFLDKEKHFRIEFNNYHHLVDNWIMWQPKENAGYWSAQNVQKVYSRGVELKLNWWKMLKEQMRLSQSLNFSVGKSEIIESFLGNSESEGKDLIYTPRYSMQYFLEAAWKEVKFRWRSSVSSKVYTSTDNSFYMPAYSLSNVDVIFSSIIGEFTVGFNVGLDNVFNIDYQVVANQPMPKRTFHLGMSLQVNQ